MNIIKKLFKKHSDTSTKTKDILYFDVDLNKVKKQQVPLHVNITKNHHCSDPYIPPRSTSLSDHANLSQFTTTLPTTPNTTPTTTPVSTSSYNCIGFKNISLYTVQLDESPLFTFDSTDILYDYFYPSEVLDDYADTIISVSNRTSSGSEFATTLLSTSDGSYNKFFTTN